jgi:hypothetical protein
VASDNGDTFTPNPFPAVFDTDDIAFRVSSFAVQMWDGGNNSAPETCEMVELRPEKDESAARSGVCIYDTLGGIRFRISHAAFFQVNVTAHASSCEASARGCQVNTAAFELLLRRLQLWVKPDANTVLFDVCCGERPDFSDFQCVAKCDFVKCLQSICPGTGSLGLSMANSVAHVVGVEMVQSAVDDAKANAEANGELHIPDPEALPRPIALYRPLQHNVYRRTSRGCTCRCHRRTFAARQAAA